jgi:protein-L-isoaspartate(D-aspartate) O-methyltransferase
MTAPGDAADGDSAENAGDSAPLSYEEARERMVEEQLRQRGITDERVLRAMGEVPRHLFVPPEMRPYAYTDAALPLWLNQTISQPYMVGLMTQSLGAAPDARVLELGTGSGYQAAVLSRLVKHVYTIERHKSLAEQAAATLKQLGYDNVTVYTGDGTLGLREFAPYDHAIITAASPSVPRAIIQQVRRDGTVLVPVGSRKEQYLLRLRKRWLGWSTENLGRVMFVPLIGEGGWKPEKPEG